VESLTGGLHVRAVGSRPATLQAGTVLIVPTLDAALAAIDSWPVPNAAAGARTPDGTVVVAGRHDRPFPLASVTKLLSAAAVLVAVEEESIGLDDPVEHPPGATVRDLLCHSSGLAFDGDVVVARPRRARVYSNRGYERLGELVTRSTGMPFAAYLHEAICAPLGLGSTTLDGSPAAGGASTVDDLLAFSAGLRTVLSAETVEAMTTPQFPDLAGVVPGFGMQRPNPWGLGPEIRDAKSPHWTGSRNSPRTWGHFGRAGTFLWSDPDAGVTLVALTDRPFGDWALTAWPALADAVLAAVPQPAPGGGT
jgi:CubicO group peptidase (beta-lactamase class C family)